MIVRRIAALALLVTLSATACHCSDECRSAAECASGVCRDGRCVPPEMQDGTIPAGDGG